MDTRLNMLSNGHRLWTSEGTFGKKALSAGYLNGAWEATARVNLRLCGASEENALVLKASTVPHINLSINRCHCLGTQEYTSCNPGCRGA